MGLLLVNFILVARVSVLAVALASCVHTPSTLDLAGYVPESAREVKVDPARPWSLESRTGTLGLRKLGRVK